MFTIFFVSDPFEFFNVALSSLLLLLVLYIIIIFVVVTIFDYDYNIIVMQEPMYADDLYTISGV